MDADALIDRNRALVALANKTCRWSREAAATARETCHIAKATRDKAAQGIGQTNAAWRLPAATGKPNRVVVSARYVQSLQAEAAEIHARVQAIIAAAKRSPPSKSPD